MTLSLTNQGFDYVAYYNGAYENADSLPALAQTGANSVELSLEYGIDPHSSTVYADSNYTDSLAALGASIRQAVALGQAVMVRPLIDFLKPSDLTGTPYSVGDWRTYYNPGAAGSATANTFFASYTTMILQEAQVAVANGATSLCIGTELDQITGPAYLGYWDTIINDLRTDDPSLKLTYAADWDDDQSPWQWGGTGLQAGTGNLATQVSFASQLDSIGIDEYAPISDAADPTLAQLVAGWTQTPTDPTSLAVTGGQSLIDYFEGVAAAIDKPLVFTELGYENATDAAAQPAGSSTNVTDSNLQAELYQAFFEAWQKAGNSSLTGVYFWNWDPNAGEVGPGEGVNFSPQGLPAQGIASDWFGSGPDVTFSAPTVGGDGQVTLSGAASDGVGVQSVEIFSGATDLGAASLNAATGSWTFATTLPIGRYSFTALATDADGKQASVIAPFVVSIAAPVAPMIGGTQGEQTTIGASPIAPFSGVTIGDANSGAVDALSIALTGGGALAGPGLTYVSPDVYALATGSPAAVSAALQALVFTPAPGAPDTTATTTFALTDVSSAGTSASNNATTVADDNPAVAPTISGMQGGQTTIGTSPIAPFSGVTIGDANSGAVDALSITLTGGGALAGPVLANVSPGVYALATGSAATVSAALQALVFTPAPGAPDATATTTFALTDVSSAGTSASNSATTVADEIPAVAPLINGTSTVQTTIGTSPIAPFSGMTIGDANSGAVDALSIALTGGGALAGPGLTNVAPGVYALATGSPAAVSAALQALVFTPALGAPDTTATTTFALTDVSSAGTNTSASGPSVVDVIPAVPTVTFNTDVSFSSRTSAMLTGSVSDASSLVGLDIYDGGQDLGAAEVNGDGSWSLTVDLPKGTYNAITAEATDIYGNTASTPASYVLETGLAPPWTTYEGDYDASGNLTGEYLSTARGKTYLEDTVQTLANGEIVYDYTGGAFFNSQDYSSYIDVYTPQFSLARETLFNDDGSHTTTDDLNYQTVQALGDDTMTAAGEHETFRFDLNSGQETITDFAATGRGHDLLSLPMGLSYHLSEILRNASQVGDNAFIALGHGSSITLDNVAVSALSAADFQFHGPSA